tara:strand:- start:378 stop:590 length:213 start_codon:yes stop_codon:yes gene_type:complete
MLIKKVVLYMVDLSLVAVLITTCAGACIGLISQIQHSRCSSISCGWGLVSCTRTVPEIEEPSASLEDVNL